MRVTYATVVGKTTEGSDDQRASGTLRSTRADVGQFHAGQATEAAVLAFEGSTMLVTV